ncbi:MAG: hypothetical protein IPM63_14070 [Acidobacteriota bacterium]|nr:MAG: hypothetical protein IPM63_14070 [Acidobacteriota bacterium]
MKSYEQEFAGSFPSAEIRDLKIENRFESEKPLRYTFHLTVPNYVQRTQTRVFFQPGVFEFGRTAIFPSEQRKYDIHFPFAWAEQDEVTITFPEGFELENTTSPNAVADRNGLASLKVNLSADMSERMIRYRRDFHFGEGTILFKASAYPAIKKLFDLFLQTDQHVIALRRTAE